MAVFRRAMPEALCHAGGSGQAVSLPLFQHNFESIKSSPSKSISLNDDQSQLLLVGGSEGVLKLLQARGFIELNAQQAHRQHGVLALAVHPLYAEMPRTPREAMENEFDDAQTVLVASGGDDKDVRICRLLKGENKMSQFVDLHLAVRMEGSVHTVAFHPTDPILAVGGDDAHIKLLNLVTEEIRSVPYAHPVKHMEFQPNGTYLAIADTNGSLQILNKEGRAIKRFPIPAKGDRQLARSSWSPSGTYLALPAKDEVNVLASGLNFSLKAVLKHEKPVSITTWSPNGRYLAAASDDKQVFVWDLFALGPSLMKSSEPLGQQETESVVTSLIWSTFDHSLFILEDTGYIKCWNIAVPEHLPAPFNGALAPTSAKTNASISLSPVTSSNHKKYVMSPESIDFAKQNKSPATKRKEVEANNRDNGGMFGEDIANNSNESATFDPSEEPTLQTSIFDDEKEVVQYSGNGTPSGTRRKRLKTTAQIEAQQRFADGLDDEYNSEEDNMDDFIVDDTNGAWRDEIKPLTGITPPSGAIHAFHPAFQSGSTPFYGKRRFLSFNTFGRIECRDEDICQSIEITFNDNSKHRPVRIKDHYFFDLAALGEHGAIFASHSHKATKATRGEDGNVIGGNADVDRDAIIFYRPFDSWAANSEWDFHLPVGEEPITVAIGQRYVAIATNRQWVRIISFSGAQRFILSLPGPVVTLAGRSNMLVAVYDTPAGLQFCMFDVHTHKRLYEGAMSISVDSTLTWIDLGPNGLLLAMDSKEVLRGLAREWDFAWCPLLELNVAKARALPKVSSSTRWWPIGLLEEKLMVAVCKGSKFPYTNPKPVIQPVDLRMPLLDTHTKVGELEEQHVRGDLMMREDWDGLSNADRIRRQAAQDKVAIQLVAHAIKNMREGRALDLSAMLRLQKSLQVVINHANKEGRSTLASRMGVIMESRFNGLDAEDQQSEDVLAALLQAQETETKIQQMRSNRQARTKPKKNTSNDSANTSSTSINQVDGEAEILNKTQRLRKGIDDQSATKMKSSNSDSVASSRYASASLTSDISKDNVFAEADLSHNFPKANATQSKLFAPKDSLKPVPLSTNRKAFEQTNDNKLGTVSPLNPFAKKT